jgi:hypothetical protein
MSQNHPSLALTILAGSRPELLRQTLDSFKEQLLPNFIFAEVFANIDLWGGTAAEQNCCIGLVKELFPGASISAPAQPSYGRAIQWLWSQPSADFVLHIEDDWLLLDGIFPDRVFPILDGDTRVVTFGSKEHRPDRMFRKYGDRYYRDSLKKRFFGFTFPGKTYNKHGVSPGFFERSFAGTWASLLNPSLDPEKQIQPAINPALFDYVADYRRYLLLGDGGEPLIRDIGREWREVRQINKVVRNGQSIWSEDAASG